MEINLEQLEEAMRELTITVNEARNLCYSGKVIQCDRKLQGSQTKCGTILSYIQELRVQEETSNVVACKTTETENTETEAVE